MPPSYHRCQEPPSHDDHRCSQTWPSVPQGAKLTLVENHCNKPHKKTLAPPMPQAWEPTGPFRKRSARRGSCSRR